MNSILDQLKSASRKVRKVNIPEVEGDIYLKAFSVKDSLEYLSYMEKNPNDSPYAVMLALSMCDENGVQIVGVDKVDEIKDLDVKIVDTLAEEFAKIKNVEVKKDEENPSNPNLN